MLPNVEDMTDAELSREAINLMTASDTSTGQMIISLTNQQRSIEIALEQAKRDKARKQKL